MLSHTMTVREAAGYLKVQPRTVREWIASGRLAASKIGKSYLIDVDEISRVLQRSDLTAEVKRPDAARQARIARMKGTLIGTGATHEALEAQRRKELELRTRAQDARL